ncbi:MAG: hypothetical protein GY765_05750 [bacterium]|nr:hypothetical protein [bacterium]
MGAIFGFSGGRNGELLQSMGQTLTHRGGKGYFCHEGKRASLGYLAGFDETELLETGAGLYAEGEQAIAVAGYVLSPKPGQNFLAGLLEDYRKQGLAFVNGLRGAFIIAVLDGKTIHLARDGAGVRTAYYGDFEKRFFFAVEPKGILAVPGFPRRLKPSSLAQYLSYSYTPGSATMLEDVHEVLPGHTVSRDGESAPVSKRFFIFEKQARDETRSEEDWVQEFRGTFQKAVAERLPSGGPVGIFLSGGLDSSVVTAEVARQYGGPVKTYSVHFGKEYTHELDFARMVADRSGTEHHEVLVRPADFLPRLRNIIRHLDDPIGDPITVPNFELFSRASRDVRRVFNGEGGDPLFGGPKNLSMMLHHWYGGISREKNFRERAYLNSYRRAYDEVTRVLAPGMLEQIDMERDLETILTPYFEAEQPEFFLDKLLAINTRLKGAHLILPKVDRMSAASGMVPLSPLFDERLMKLAFAMPPNLKVAGGIEKIVIKRAYKNDVPYEIIKRPKSGMRVPVYYWFLKELKRYARKILSRKEIKRAGIFNYERVRRLLDFDSSEGMNRHGIKLWMLLTFEMWRRIVIEGESV